MTLGPKIPKKDPFNQTLRGTFGRFKTKASREVFYLLCSIPIDDIDDLSTASDFFEADALQFDELIQRDIDRARVIRMADGYLMSAQNKAVFFPPLLACIVLFDADGKMQHQYTDAHYQSHEEEIGRVMRAIWDEDGFELSLALGDKKSADRRIEVNGQQEWFHDAGQLRLNQKRAKLIVLDGQHRLEAMKLVRNGPAKSMLDGTEVPVCLVFTPTAVQGTQEDVVENFRELFVRVNEEAKRVSGHFIILLQDDSYAAFTVRALAEAWRLKKANGVPYLHLLEWNQRVEENTRRRSRPFSITTISILHDILRDYLFKELAPTVLRLDEVKDEFDAIDASFHYADLSDQAHSPAIDKIVEKQIVKYLVPALDTLFLRPSPYHRFVSNVQQAFAKMEQQVAAHNDAFGALQESFSRYKYTDEEIALKPVKLVLQEFNSWISIPEQDGIYFMNAFQHGLVRSWIRVSTILAVHGYGADIAAEATVMAFEQLVLRPEKGYLTSGRKYTRRVLWRNENVNFGTTQWTRDVWVDALCATLLNPKVMAAALGACEGAPIQEISSALSKEALASAHRYCKRLRNEVVRDTRTNIAELVSEGKLLELETMQAGDENARKKYEAEISAIAGLRYKEAADELANTLEISSKILEQE